MGKQTLADLSRNEQVEIVSTAPAEVDPRWREGTKDDAQWRVERGNPV